MIDKTSNDTDSPANTAAPHRSPIPGPLHTVENTDLERRVLAHERILQVLIAHMAEAEPKFLDRLRAVFSDHMRVSRAEHDYTDTDAYAERFIREVLRLGDRAYRPHVSRERPQSSHSPEWNAGSSAKPSNAIAIMFQMRHRAGIWEVTKDGLFFGHYNRQQQAWDAAKAAAAAVIADGGSADVSTRAD